VYGEKTEVTPSKPDHGTIGIKAETRNQRGDVVQSFTATLLVPRRA
jgi:acyl dehydratase